MTVSSTRQPSIGHCCGWLATAGLALVLLLSFPAYSVAGTRGLEGLAYAAILCLVPGFLVFAVATAARSQVGSAQVQMMTVLLGTGFRFLFVAAGALVVPKVRPDLGFRAFVVWLLVFYLVTLVVETWLLTRQAGSQTDVSRQVVGRGTTSER